MKTQARKGKWSGTKPLAGDRTPPHDANAEMAVLSSVMYSPREAIGECAAAGVEPPWFFVPAHRTIYQELRDMWDSGQNKIDMITFSDWLQNKGLLDEVGGRYAVTKTQLFIDEVFNFNPTLANLPEHIKIVRDKYELRWGIVAATEFVRRAYEPQAGDEGAQSAFDLLESSITSIRSLQGVNGAAEFSDGVPLMTLAEREIETENNLLCNRYLCRDGIMFFVGPSGVGKSSVSAQQDISWALGRPAFHIRPARPLRILCVQAENDIDDLTEMASGVVNGLNLTAEEREIVRRNVIYVSDCSHTGAEFLRMLEHYLKKYVPIDLVRIDTLLAYLGGDILDVEITSKFLRNGLNALLRKYHCGAIINHHTPKPTNTDRSQWKPSDWMYFGAGNADLTNAPRATMSMDSTHAPDVFEFRAGKRGRRIGWVDEKGEPIFVRYFCWEKGDKIFWRDATDEDIERVQSLTPRRHGHTIASKGTIEDLFALIPLEGAIEKNVLLQKAADESRGEMRIGEKRARAFLTELIDAGRAFPWRIKRPKTNPRIEISRHEQTIV